MSLFRNYTILNYNNTFYKKLLYYCECYKYYRTRENFFKMLDKKKILNVPYQTFSYMACVENDGNIEHLSVPIMLGSYLDYSIRDEEEVAESHLFWGAYILNGTLVTYNIFSTFDALSLHVTNSDDSKKRSNASQHVKFYTYLDNSGFEISYRDRNVTFKYDLKKLKNYNQKDPDLWLELLRRSNPYTQKYFSVSQYFEMYESMIRVPYVVNLLSNNRYFVSGSFIINKYINDYFKQTKNSKQSLKEAFESGTIYTALSKNNTLETNEHFKKYSQNYNTQLNEGRSDKVELFLPTVSRATSKRISNSDVLHFPSDAFGFFCTLDTKDHKSAGEQHILCKNVIISENTDDFEVFRFLKKQKTNLNAKDVIVLNGYLIDCKMEVSFENLMILKKKFPQISTRYFECSNQNSKFWYVHISTKQSILLKYLYEHDCFFSPAEIVMFKLKIPEHSSISLTASKFPLEVLRSDEPARTTVSINNAKCSIAIKQNLLHEKLMKNSLGTSCYINQEISEQALNFSVLEESCENIFQNVDLTDLKKMKKQFLLNSEISNLNPLELTNEDIAANKHLKKVYDVQLWRYESNNHNDPKAKKNFIKTKKNENKTKGEHITNYSKLTLSNYNKKSTPIYNIKLWFAFGDKNGGTIEDGFIFDKKTAEKLEYVHYNLHLTVTFSFENKTKARDVKFINTTSIDIEGVDQDILIAQIAAKHLAKPKNSKHIKISECHINQTVYYLIYFKAISTNIYKKITIFGEKIDNTFKIFIYANKLASFGIGTKLTNFSGQKCVCSKVTDLSSIWGIVPDKNDPSKGKKVHAQVLQSDVSLLSRLTVGQLKYMLLSDELAHGPNGIFLAPCYVNIHPLHPFTNEKIFDLKNDTLTNINGFDSQNLSNVSLALRNNVSVKEDIPIVFGLHGFKLNFYNDLYFENSTPNKKRKLQI